MRDFVNEHRALLFKHARTYVRNHGEKVPAEDVAREMELELLQLHERKGLVAKKVDSPDSYLRAIAKHACGRAKRRRKLVEQVAAGDDLGAVSDDLAALDADLPGPPDPPPPEATGAREVIDSVKSKLRPRDALVFALLYEDDEMPEDVARTLAMPPAALEEARQRILIAASEVDGADRVLDSYLPESMLDRRQR